MLEQFKEQAVRAHYWTSFSPERRGESTVSEAENELQSDIEELKKGGASEESIQFFTERFKHYFSNWLGAKSRCMSSMIAGPAKFPVRRAEKANRSEHNHYTVFQAWRKKAVKAIIRKAQPEKTYNSEIERLKGELQGREEQQELMRNLNSAYRSFKKKGSFKEEGFTEAQIKYVKEFKPAYSYIKQPFTYHLSNNLQNIKRIEERIKELEAKEAVRNEAPETEFEFEGGKVVLNYEADRVQIFFNQKPEEAKRTELKRNGFRFAPSQNNAWQRQITGNAFYAVHSVTGVNLRKN